MTEPAGAQSIISVIFVSNAPSFSGELGIVARSLTAVDAALAKAGLSLEALGRFTIDSAGIAAFTAGVTEAATLTAAQEQKLALTEQELAVKTEALRQQEAVRTGEIQIREMQKTAEYQARLAAKQIAEANGVADAQIGAARRASSGTLLPREVGSVAGGSIAGAAGARVGRLGGLLGGIGGGTAFAVGGAIALGEATRYAIEYDSALAKVHATTTITTQDFAQLDPTIRRLAVTYGQSQTQLAEAAQLIYSDGLKGVQATQALEESAKGAAIGLGSVTEVANILGPTLNAYASSGLSASNVTDLLAKAAQEGHIPLGTFAQNLGKLVGPAASLGVSLPELLANYATLSQTNPNQAQVTTGINSIIIALTKLDAPTKQGRAALDKLGLSSAQLGKDLRGKGLLATIEELSAASDKYAAKTGGANDAILQLIPNQRALRDLFGSTAGDSLQRYAANLDGVNQAAGQADRALAIVNQTLSQELKQGLAGLRNDAIELGHFFEPILRELIDGGKHIYEALAPIFGPVVIAGFAVLAGTIKVAAAGFDDLAKFLDHNHALVDALGIAFAVALAPRILLATQAFASFIALDAKAAVGQIVGGFRALISPLGLATVGVGVMAYAFIHGREEAEKFRKAAAAAAAQLDPTLNASSFSSYGAFVAQYTKNNDALAASLARTSTLAGHVQFGVLNPVLDVDRSQIDTANASFDTQNDHIKAIAKAAGVSLPVAYAAAKAAGIDLSKAMDQSNDDIYSVANSLISAADAAGVTTTEMSALAEASGQTGTEVATNMQKVKDAFAQASDAISGFKLVDSATQKANIQAALDTLNNAKQAVTDAETRASNAGQRIGAQAVGKGGASKQLTASQVVSDSQSIASAQRTLSKAQTDAATAQANYAKVVADNTKTPAQQLESYYSKTLGDARTFLANIQTATQEGLNPGYIAKLLEAGPAQASDVLTGIVDAHSKRIISIVNSSQAAIRQISEQAALYQTAADIGTQSIAKAHELPLAQSIIAQIQAQQHASVESVAEALKVPVSKVQKAVTDFQITDKTGNDLLQSRNPAIGRAIATGYVQLVASHALALGEKQAEGFLSRLGLGGLLTASPAAAKPAAPHVVVIPQKVVHNTPVHVTGVDPQKAADDARRRQRVHALTGRAQ